MGLVGASRNSTVVRGGVIAQLRDLFDHTSETFLVDSFVFPGNSGGPVVSRPETTSIVGTVGRNRSDLIGIVARYLPYRDVAVSQQTRQPRIIFEENSGLTVVFPVEYIQEIIADFESKYPLKEPEPTIISEVKDEPLAEISETPS